MRKINRRRRLILSAIAVGGLGAAATADLDAKVQAASAAPAGDLLDLGEHFAAEGLAAEAGLDGHEEHEIDLVE